MKNIAIYAGTFDPITFGHIDVIKRAVTIFDKIILAVAANPNKKPLFSLAKRVALCRSAVSKLPKVKVAGFEGLLLQFAKEQKANIIIRGLRTVTDFEHEFQLANMNRNLNPTIETMFLMPDEKYMSISSSLVREIALLNGNVKNFVPPIVVKAFKELKN